jgi:NAD(P) transhydrogenase subunit alpha
MPVLAVTKERRAGETRVAVTPDAAKKLIALGLEVVVEAGAGLTASAPDADYEAAGARVVPTAAAALDGADLVLKVRGPAADQIAVV